MNIYRFNEKEVTYQIKGDGPSVIWSPGGFSGVDVAQPVADKFVEEGFKVVTFDRPTTEHSDLVFDGDHLLRIWAECMHSMLSDFGLLPVVAGGGSGGMCTSLYFAHMFPEDVSALLLVSPPTRDQDIWEGLISQTLTEPGRIARDNGMGAVIEHGGALFAWDNQVDLRPQKKDQLLSMDGAAFASKIEIWAETWAGSGRPFLSSLEDDEIKKLQMPIIIVSGPDPLHPLESSELLHKTITHSELLAWYDLFSEETTKNLLDQGRNGAYCDAALVPYLNSFLRDKV